MLDTVIHPPRLALSAVMAVKRAEDTTKIEKSPLALGDNKTEGKPAQPEWRNMLGQLWHVAE